MLTIARPSDHQRKPMLTTLDRLITREEKINVWKVKKPWTFNLILTRRLCSHQSISISLETTLQFALPTKKLCYSVVFTLQNPVTM